MNQQDINIAVFPEFKGFARSHGDPSEINPSIGLENRSKIIK